MFVRLTLGRCVRVFLRLCRNLARSLSPTASRGMWCSVSSSLLKNMISHTSLSQRFSPSPLIKKIIIKKLNHNLYKTHKSNGCCIDWPRSVSEEPSQNIKCSNKQNKKSHGPTQEGMFLPNRFCKRCNGFVHFSYFISTIMEK